jgi:hypothetical protein
MDTTAWSIIGLAAAACPWVALWAYRAGRRTGSKKTMPWRPIFQLVDHRTHCLGHDATRVRSDLQNQLPLTPVAWGEVLAMRRPVMVAHVPSRMAAGMR